MMLSPEWEWSGLTIKRVRKGVPYMLCWEVLKRPAECPLIKCPHLHEAKIVIQIPTRPHTNHWYYRRSIHERVYTCATMLEGMTLFARLATNRKVFDPYLDNILMEQLL